MACGASVSRSQRASRWICLFPRRQAGARGPMHPYGRHKNDGRTSRTGCTIAILGLLVGDSFFTTTVLTRRGASTGKNQYW